MATEPNTNLEGAASKRPLSVVDWLVPAVIFAFCAGVIYVGFNLDEAPEIIIGMAMQPRVFPIFLMVLIAVLNVILIIQVLGGNHMPRVNQPVPTWASVGLMIVFYLLTTYLDMFIALTAVMFIMCLVWGERRIWLAGLVAVITPLTIFFLFDLVLKIRFPRGILTTLYYG